MIKPIVKDDLINCLEIFHQGYETIAIEFGLTIENCPDRGRASLPYEKLRTEFENGAVMFGYYFKDKLVGYIGMRMHDDGVCKLDDIIVLPEYRQNGYGKELLDFCKQTAKKLGAYKVALGIDDD
jgi:ribosomal protein S18 acetylase RimI-like enzyme